MNLKHLMTVLLMAAVAAPTPADASGLLAVRFGGEHGHPTTSNPTAIYFNPAGLSLMGGTRLFLDGTLAWRKFTYTRDPGAIDNLLADPNVGTGTPEGAGVQANSGKAELFNVLASPFFGLATDFGVEGLGAGLAFYAPFGGSSSWDTRADDPLFPGSKDGAQRWWVIEGTLRALYVSGAVSYRIPSLRLSLGLSGNLVISQMNTIRARNPDGTDHLVSGGALNEGRALVDVSTMDVSLGVGVIWEPIDNLFLGLSYQSQPGFGESRLSGDTTLVFGAGPTDDVAPTPSEFFNAWPDVVRFGARYRVPDTYEVRLFGEFARWSVLEEHCLLNTTVEDRSCTGDAKGKIVIVPRAWEDTFALRAGGSYWVIPAVELYLGAGWDGSAIPDTTLDPGLFDSEKFSVALGARVSLLDDSLLVGLTYSQILYPQRTTAPRGRFAPDPSRPDTTLTDINSYGIRDAARDPDAAGTYDHTIGVVDLNVEYRF